jgi:hypothetical protein
VEEHLTPTGIKLRRVDIAKEVKDEKEEMRQKRTRDIWFKLKSTAISMYYGMNVKTIAGKVSQFLRLYHESLQSLV